MQTLSGPGEEMSKALSNLIQVGPALGRGEGLSQLTFSGPFQPGLFCGSVEAGLGVGGVGGMPVLGGEDKS